MTGLRPAAFWGLALLIVAARGDQTGAPLESTRQELRKLQGGQATKSGPSATEGLRPSMPVIQTPGQEVQPIMQLTEREKLEKERKLRNETRKNWLVDGVQQLEKSEKGNEPAAPVPVEQPVEEDGRDGQTAPDADPQYLLKLYDEQKKTEEARAAEVKAQRPPRADPLAPFLQGWLGNSPVRGQFFDEFVRRPDAQPAGTQPMAMPAGNQRQEWKSTSAPAASGPAVEPKPNPYLAELSLPPRQEPPASGLPGLTSPLNSSLNPGLPQSQPLTPAAELPADVRPPDRKAPPPPLADDKKYFPQLKRF